MADLGERVLLPHLVADPGNARDLLVDVAVREEDVADAGLRVEVGVGRDALVAAVVAIEIVDAELQVALLELMFHVL